MMTDESHSENTDECEQINQESVDNETMKAEEVDQKLENYGIDVPLVHLVADEPHCSMTVSYHLMGTH